MSRRCPCPWDNPCWFCEEQAEDAAAEARGDHMSQRDRDRMSDRAADRYEREVLGL